MAKVKPEYQQCRYVVFLDDAEEPFYVLADVKSYLVFGSSLIFHKEGKTIVVFNWDRVRYFRVDEDMSLPNGKVSEEANSD